MQVIFLIGRILFVAIFLVSGVRKLLDLAATARIIEGKLWIPDIAAPYAEKLSTMTGMPTPQLVAIVLAIVQIVFALFIIFNVGSRFAAIVLAIYVAFATAFAFDFSNLGELARSEAGTSLLKNVALFGGLLIPICHWLLAAGVDRGRRGICPRNARVRRGPRSYNAKTMSKSDHQQTSSPKWKFDGVRVIPGHALDPNTAQTAGMDRKAAINAARVGAQKIWAGTVSIHPNAKTGAHHHGALESVIYVVRGHARMRWGEHLEFVAEAGPGDFIFVPPYVPHQEINASPDEVLECVLVRSDNEAVVVNLDMTPAEKPENVPWIDPIHKA